jgi:hypothetical protein
MASNINYISIQETFPIAGRDNDSQGFRDNFNYIKNSLMEAKSEIEDLQSNVVRVDQSNDFGGNDMTEGQNIVGANLLKCSEEYYNGDTTNTNTYVDYNNGSFQSFQATGSDLLFTLDNFPVEGKAGRMRVHITSDGKLRSYKFASQNGSLKKSPAAIALFNNTNIQCTVTIANTDPTTPNRITCASNTNLQLNQPIRFTGTTFGGLTTNTLYFVKEKFGSTQFSVSNAIVTSTGVAGTVLQLTAGTGSMYIEPAFIASSDVQVFDFWTVNNGVTMFMDYLGTYV